MASMAGPIRRTYGKPKPVIGSDDVVQETSSDLTDLSQLSARPSSSLSYKRPLFNPSSSDAEDIAMDVVSEAGAFTAIAKAAPSSSSLSSSSMVHNDSGYFGNEATSKQPARKTVAELMREIDEADDEDVSAILRDGQEEQEQEPAAAPAAAAAEEEEDLDSDRAESATRGRSPSSSSQNNPDYLAHPPTRTLEDDTSELHTARLSSPATSSDEAVVPVAAKSATANDNNEDETEPIRAAPKRIFKKSMILDSDDEEQATPAESPAPPATKTMMALHRPAAWNEPPTSDEDDVVVGIKQHRRKLVPKSSSNSSAESQVGQSQNTEDIEQYQEEEPKGKSGRPSKAPKGPTKKEIEEANALEAAQKRHRDARLAPGTRAPRTLAEIFAKIDSTKNGPTSGSLSGNSSSAAKSSSVSSARRRPVSSLSFKPLGGSGLASASSRVDSRSSVTPAPASTRLRPPRSNVIEITSSSVIYDPEQVFGETQDAAYLESQSQTLDMKPVQAAKSRMTTAPAIVDDDDEDLPDIQEQMLKDQKARQLRAKKAELLMRQQAKADEELAKIYDVDSQSYDWAKAAQQKEKGKGKAVEPAKIDRNDSEEDDDLEVVLPATAAPAIAKRQQPRLTQPAIGGFAIKQEPQMREHEDLTESQFARAGRTFGRGDRQISVAPHVEIGGRRQPPQAVQQPAAKPKPSKKGATIVSQRDQNRILLGKAKHQANADSRRRAEDWQRRGGTLRASEDDRLALAARVSVQSLEDNEGDEEDEQERADSGRGTVGGLIEQMRAGAGRMQGVASEEEADEDEDEEDGDYLGSADEDGSGDEAGANGMDLDGASDSDEDEEERELKRASREQQQQQQARAESQGSASPGSARPSSKQQEGIHSAETVRIGTTSNTENSSSVAGSPSRPVPTSETDDQDEVTVFRRPAKPRAVVTADEDEDDQQDEKESESQGASERGQAVPDFAVQTQVAFPTFDDSKMEKISLTQAFGNPEDSQSAAPQASRADLGGFSQMFGENGDDGFGDGFIDSQMEAMTPSQAPRNKVLPKMFAKANDTPVLARHVIGEAPVILDAALRDAELRDEAEKAYYELQQRKAQAAASRAPRDLTTTPGSTTSEEYEPLPIVTELVQRMDDRYPDEDDDDDDEFDMEGSITQARPRENGPPSEGAAHTAEEESQDSPSFPRRRLLRRAGDGPTEASDIIEGSENELSDADDAYAAAPRAPANAFDLLKRGAACKAGSKKDAAELRKRMKANEFLAEQADESEEEEGMYSAMRRTADGDGDESDGNSDLDKEVAEILDDEKVDAALEEEQDALALARYQKDLGADDARNLKMAQKVAAGEMKKRKKGLDGLDESDYEDDEAMYRKAKARKQLKFDDKMLALAANEETAPFAKLHPAQMAVGHSQELDTQYLTLEDPNAGTRRANKKRSRISVSRHAGDNDADEASENGDGDTEYSEDEEEEDDAVGYGDEEDDQDMLYVRDTPERHGRQEIERMIFGSNESIRMEQPRVRDGIAAIMSRTGSAFVSQQKKTHVSAHDEFGDLDLMYSYTESQATRRTIVVEGNGRDESQSGRNSKGNDRGLGPGKSSAVTSFATKRQTVSSNTTVTSSSTATSHKLKLNANKSLLSRSTSNVSVGGKGRLAQARMSRKL